MANHELDALFRKLRKDGWTREKTGGNHYKWIGPNGGFVFTSSTASCPFAIRKIKNDLKNIGANL